MPAKSSATQYGAVAVTLHWLSALLIVAMIVSGFRAAGTEDPAAKASILQLHINFRCRSPLTDTGASWMVVVCR